MLHTLLRWVKCVQNEFSWFFTNCQQWQMLDNTLIGAPQRYRTVDNDSILGFTMCARDVNVRFILRSWFQVRSNFYENIVITHHREDSLVRLLWQLCS